MIPDDLDVNLRRRVHGSTIQFQTVMSMRCSRGCCRAGVGSGGGVGPVPRVAGGEGTVSGVVQDAPDAGHVVAPV